MIVDVRSLYGLLRYSKYSHHLTLEAIASNVSRRVTLMRTVYPVTAYYRDAGLEKGPGDITGPHDGDRTGAGSWEYIISLFKEMICNLAPMIAKSH